MNHEPLRRPVTTATRRLETIEGAADYLRTTPRTIRRAIAEGRINGYRFGKRMIRVDLDEIDAALRPIRTAGGVA